MPRLIVIKGVDEGKQFDLTGDVAGAGRDSSNRIKLHDTEASRRHAEFVRSPEGYRLLDLGSSNGTFVNNQPIRDVLLKPGDRVQIGQTVLVYSAGATPDGLPDLADRISLITRQDLELSSAIVKTIGETEGSRILAHPEQVEGPWLKNALANLGIMYEAIQAVSHILDLEQLLERIMDLIFRSLDADRGCIMLRREGEPGQDPDALEFEPKAVRWRDGANRQEKIPVSRTVMDYVLKEKQGLLVSDAARDERFQSGQSIVRFGIREVLCVPMKGRHDTLGVLYLDTRTPPREGPGGGTVAGRAAGKFTGDHLALAIAIAHQAALAVEDTRYHQAMMQAERLAAIGQTVAALSHHIKNILHGLQFGGEMLEKGLADRDDDMLETGWRMIKKNQGKISDLVKDMLSYSKEREPGLEETDLNAVARDVVELLSPGARERGIELTARLDDGLPRCPADPEGVHRMLLNLVGNALDAVEEVDGAQVEVSSGREPEGGWVRLVVRDNGPGITPEKQADIFRPFVSTKGARGTGLGLAVSRKIAREHGGDVIVFSAPGDGSSFVLRLPLRGPAGQDVGRTQTIPLPAESD